MRGSIVRPSPGPSGLPLPLGEGAHPNYHNSPGALDFQQHPRRILDHIFDPIEKNDCFTAVDNSVVVCQREIHHRPNYYRAIERYRTVLDGMKTEHAALRRIHNWRRQHGTVDAAIADRECSAL